MKAIQAYISGNPARNSKLANVIAIHIRATGPVSFDNVWDYAREQGWEDADDCDVAEVINNLIADGYVAIYDDGKSFTAGSVEWTPVGDRDETAIERAAGLERDLAALAGDLRAEEGAKP